MALIIKDRVKEITTSTGTGAVSLGGASATFDAFQSVMSNGDTTYYAIVHTASGTDEWEVGLGTWNTGNTLTRTTVLAGSNGTSAVTFSSGNKDVFMTYPADKAVFFNADGDVDLNRDPQTALQAATKQYVDTIAAAGLHYHAPVRVEHPSNLTATYDNGTSGVGATLTNSGTQAALVLDNVTMVVSDRVLIANQTNQAHNGVYTVTNIGSASTNWVLTRATDADSYGPSDPDAFGKGDAFFIKEGDTNAGHLDVLTTTGTIVFGTTNIVFSEVAETTVYSAGDGLTLTGTQFAVGAGTGVTVNANNVAIGQAVGTSDSPTFAGLTVGDGHTIGDDVGDNLTLTSSSAENIIYNSNAGTHAFKANGTDTVTFDGSGNITVTGTVDGRDVATDGIKLDGIESGATADQTASEILTALLGVDGASSNLDADLLDGQHGSYYLSTTGTAANASLLNSLASTQFLRSDAADTKTAGDLSFADNVKAIFGAGSDLEIYHSGTASVIHDNGTGNLELRAGSFRLKNGANTAFLMKADVGGAVTLYYDNASKLATTSTGIDVTGTVTADQLTVYNGTSDPDVLFRNNGTGDVTLTFRRGAADDVYTDWSLVNDSGTFKFISDNSADPDHTQLTMSQGDISFYEATGTTAKFFWDASAERLGIGTSSPSANLNVASSNATIHLTDTDDTTYAEIRNNGGTFTIASDEGTSATNSSINFRVDATERMRIDSSGNVGIGTTSPSSYHANADNLVIQDSGNAGITIATTDSAYFSQINFADGTSGAQAYTGILRYAHSDNSLRIIVNAGEKMRIDSSGNVGIGTSSPSSTLDVNGNASVSGTLTQGGNTVLDTSTTFGGDVSGTYDAIVVANDSHSHAFNNLTSKTSGTGEYSTNNAITSGRGSGGISLTVNDGYGNANITFNHKNGVPEQNGQSGRITLNTDNTVSGNAQMDFELGLGTSGTAVNIPPVFSLFDDEVKTWQPLTVTGNITVSGTVDGVDIAGSIDQAVLTTSSPTFGGMTLNGDLTLGAYNVSDVHNVYLDNALVSTGDTDTYFQFHTANQARIVCAGAEVMEWGNNYAKMNDNDTLYFGAGYDFQIYHNGTNNYIRNRNHAQGNIYIQGEDTSGVNHTIAAFYSANAAPYAGLYYDGTEVFTTVSGGVNVAGTCTATSFSGDGSNLTNVAASTVLVSESVDDSVDYNILFSDTSGTGNVQMSPVQDDGGLTFNPSTNYLATGSIQIQDRISHSQDADSYMQFHNNDEWRVVLGSFERLEVTGVRTWVNRLFVNSGVVEDHETLSGTTPTCDAGNAGYFSLTMTGNTTFTFSTPWTTVDSIGFVLELTGNGGTVTWPTSVEWAGGTAPDAPASGETDLLVFNTRDGGTTWYGMLAIDAAA